MIACDSCSGTDQNIGDDLPAMSGATPDRVLAILYGCYISFLAGEDELNERQRLIRRLKLRVSSNTFEAPLPNGDCVVLPCMPFE